MEFDLVKFVGAMNIRQLKYYLLFWLAAPTVLAQSTKIDHVLIAADNLDSAKLKYESYGFNVVYGGSEKKALNALIFLKDGTLIELIGKDRFPTYYTWLNEIGFTKLLGLMKDRITRFPKAPTGLFNYCLYSSNLDSTYSHLKNSEIKCGKPKKIKRNREDGVRVKWSLIGTSPYDLPFFINDYNPPRISDSSLLEHTNGALGIDSLEITTNEFDSYVKIYNLIYSQTPVIRVNSRLRTAVYLLQGQYIILKETSQSFIPFSKNENSIPVHLYLRKKDKSKKAVGINAYLHL